jgi:hypothetical protein
MASISIDVDIDDVLWGMSSREKQELVDDLYDDGYVPKQLGGVHPDDGYDTDFDEQVAKLIGNGWKLSKEDMATILKITNKLI